MYLKLISLILIFLFLPSSASQEIYVSKGRITLLSLNSLIKGEAKIFNPDIANVFILSGLDNEEDRSVIAIQGLKSSGVTDLSFKTSAGTKIIKLIASTNKGVIKDLEFNTRRNMINHSNLKLNPKRACLVKLRAPINEFLISGDPALVNFEHVVNYYDDEFLKTFSLRTFNLQGSTDLVIATKNGIEKINIEVAKGVGHDSSIRL